MVLIAFSVDYLLPLLLRLSKERLTSKQKLILNILRQNTYKRPVTQIVAILAKELDCSLSAIWLNLNQLKRIQLVQYSSQNDKGKPVKLTPIGTWLARNMKPCGLKTQEERK
ncbi:MAG: hypothetical protein HY363_03190 [Candidatus Aenigmarchaeota archaeon]|nr:hypothetical protein [Candidatus Aenigmarchaeota archaeon]